MAPAQYRSPPQAPPLFTATASSLVADAKELCDKTRDLLDRLVATVEPEDATFENVVLPMAQSEDVLALKARIIGFYQATSTDAALRDASSKAEEIMDDFGIEASMREDVFRLVDAAWEKAKKQADGLDGESLRFLENERKSYIRNGLGIEKGLKRDRFKEIKKRLSTCNANVPLFKEAIVLRDEAARLLGYPDWASFRIEDKMAKTPQTVNDFLNDLRRQLTPGGAKEVAHLLEIKNEDLKNRGLEASQDGNYYLWDARFYGRMMVEKEFSIDEQKIAEYFPLQSTVEGMLKIFEELFGFVFIELGPEDKAKLSATGKAEDIYWHEDVKIFSVWDDEGEGSGFVGYLYLDLHPRPGKYGHAANFNLQPGFLYPNGTRRYPATALVCNFSKPTPTKPSLLKHDEVVTLFHELGHGIHDLAARTKYSRFHGTSVVRDFVEAPSQMLENWCWTPSQLKGLSKHYETGDQIPDDLITKQISVKHVNDALFNLRQLHFGIFDMTIHTPASHAVAEAFSLSSLYNTLRQEISGLKGPEELGSKPDWGNGQATFGHLIGGYDAGYYGYLSSQVYSTDMFHSVFKKDPMNRFEGRRYRHMVLEKGGSQEEMKTLEDFLGRKPSTEAFYKELGLPAK
ncbi:unnamed protein product [Diplocarpon coronariae]